jgi:hypothetical protein
VREHTKRQSSTSKDMTCTIVNIRPGFAFLLLFQTSEACAYERINILKDVSLLGQSMVELKT